MNHTDEVSWTLMMLRGMQEVLTERTEMKVDSPLIASQLSQVDRQENHLKHELIFFFFFFFWSEGELHFRYLLTSLDGFCHRLDGARGRV